MRSKSNDNGVQLNVNGQKISYIPRRYQKLQKDALWLILLTIIPQIILTCIFYIYVNFDSLMLAFTDNLGNFTLITLKTAWEDLTNINSQMGVALINTLLFFTKDLLMLFFQLFICYFFYKRILGTKFFQIMFYLPLIVSGVATVIVFRNFIDPQGPLGAMLKSIGIDLPHYLGIDGYDKFLFTSKASWTILIYSIWTGWATNMLLLNGALARIPVEILESARLDGISSGKEFTKIIFPLVWSTFSTLLILSFTGLLGAGGPTLLFDEHATMNTWTIGYWMFYRIKYTGQYNIVSAMGLYLTLIAVPVIMLARKLVEKVPTVEY